jgi:hypothetical protein
VAESQGPRLSASETRRALSGGSDGALSRRLNETRCNSFTAGTLVETEADLAPIEEIDLGDNVLAEDPTTGEQGYYEVVALTNHPTNEILKVTLEAESQEAETLDSTADSGDNENIQLNSQTDDDPPAKIQNLKSEMEVTSDHPVYIEGQGWLNAENLSIGDRLRRADGGYARVLAIERVKLAEPEPVYNFTVKGLHTYFVLEVGVLVHNCGPVWDESVQRWRDPKTGQFVRPRDERAFAAQQQHLANPPIRYYAHPDYGLIPQYEEGTLFRAVTIADPNVDASITRMGHLSAQARGVTREPISKLPPDAPFNERVVEYVVPEGGGKFPRNTNLVGLREDPGEAIRIAQGSGADDLLIPGSYIRLDEIRVYPDEVGDADAIFKAMGLKPKHPPLKGEFIHDGSIPPERIVNTIRLEP